MQAVADELVAKHVDARQPPLSKSSSGVAHWRVKDLNKDIECVWTVSSAFLTGDTLLHLS